MIEIKDYADNKNFGSVIGAAIRKERNRKSISQEELGEIIGVTRQTVATWERNASGLPIGQLIKVFDALKVPLEDYPLFKNNSAMVDEKPLHSEEGKVMPAITAYFKSFDYRNMVAEILKLIDYLTFDEIELILKICGKLAEKDQAVDDAYRRGVKDATIICAIHSAKERGGYEEGVRKAEEDELEYTLHNIEENREAIEYYEEADDELSDCGVEAVCALHDTISDRIYEEDFEAGYDDAKREYEQDHFDGDWDDI